MLFRSVLASFAVMPGDSFPASCRRSSAALAARAGARPLKKLLNHPDTPIQIVIAGKAHPADDSGKGLIQQMVRFADQDEVRGKLVFLPDYDISLAKPLYPGCDVWLNNPLRPMEACGTSGMKAAMNGAFNLLLSSRRSSRCPFPNPKPARLRGDV